MSSAQAEVTVTPIYEPSWQSAPVTTAVPVNIVIKGSAEERELFGATAPKLEVDSSVYKNDETECTSWQCASKNESSSVARQVQNLDQYLPALTAAAPAEESEPIVVTGAKSKLSYADRLMKFLWAGRHGRRYEGQIIRKTHCGKGMRAIFETAGLFKKGIGRSNSTKFWGPYLKKQGFKNMGINSPYCKVPGTIRMYDGTKIPVERKTMGVIHGHIEFVGTDGRFHSSTSSDTSRDSQVTKGRRDLLGCYVKNSEVEV